jgi:hypothetical protein
MIDPAELCRRGYFPRELPPAFTSRSFGDYIHDEGGAISSYPTTKPTRMNLRRAGGFRRPLTIPNPFSYFDIATQLAANWADIDHLYSRGIAASTAPVINATGNGRYLLPRTPFLTLPLVRAKRRSRARFVVLSDLSQCYASIYTHSIPWALMGKGDAKAAWRSRGATPLVGDNLDRSCQRSQDLQTKGIAIGPDASLALAELVLTRIDIEMAKRMGFDGSTPFPLVRIIDDFEYYASSRSEAESALIAWEQSANEFELSINIEKTEILELPSELDHSWIAIANQFILRQSSQELMRNDLLSFFSIMFDLASKDPTAAVITFAIQRINKECLSNMNQVTFDVYCDLLLPASIAEPSALRVVASALKSGHDSGLSIPNEALAGTLNEIVNFHSKLDHGSEVAWALSILGHFDLKVTKENGSLVALMSDNFCLILLRLLEENGNLEDTPDFGSAISRSQETGVTLGSDWLLGYEYAHRGWSDQGAAFDEPLFNDLHRAGISFLDIDDRLLGSLPTQSILVEPPTSVWDESRYHLDEDENTMHWIPPGASSFSAL